MIKTLKDYYKFSELPVEVRLEGSLVDEKGFFLFGANTSCFGGTTILNTVKKEHLNLVDVGTYSSLTHGHLSLPFVIDEIVNNLRLEKYIENSISREDQSTLNRAFHGIYYFLRPIFPVQVRKHLQRVALGNWQNQKFPHWPVDFSVDNLCEGILKTILRDSGSNKIPFIWFWPKGYSACIMMTHDVETAVGRDACGNLMDIEDQFGFKSSFEIVPEVRYEVPESFLDEIRTRGREICLHGLNHDGQLFASKQIFLERVGRINDYAEKFGAIGFRSPVMYRNVEWFKYFRFKYDMSIPNVGQLDPQRGGCCTVMPFFIGNVLELPLTTIQDYSLYHYLEKDTIDLWKRQASMIIEKSGLISFIIHPDYTLSNKKQEIYSSLLQHLCALRDKKNAWVALPREVYHWWNLRSQMNLVTEYGRTRIIGEGNENARLAHAMLDGNSLKYELE
jgi:hypothetical protein